MRHVIVIGAGPAGITAAYVLARSGKVRVTVLEASASVGGMARTIELWGQRVDIGPHRFFSSDTRVNRLWLEVIGRDYEMVQRLTRIHYRNRFFYYPLRPGNALWNLGLLEAVRCMSSYAWARMRGGHDMSTFEGWVVSRFGRRLYEIFFKSYTEKLWGIPCTQLDADFAAQRIKKLSLFEALKNAFFGGRSTKHKTLVDEFAYPHGGTGAVYERMSDAVVAAQGVVRLGTPVEAVRVEEGRAVGVRLDGGECMAADHVISTMPISLLVERMEVTPPEVRQACAALRFRNTLLVYLQLEGGTAPLWPDQWLYVHSPGLGVGRVTNFENWSTTLRNGRREPILALEYWCYPEDGAWREPDKALVARATEEIARAGLDGGRKVLAGHVVRLPRCYPVYASGYKQHLATVEGWLRGIRELQPIGRYGAFKYNNQDHSILMGLLAAENVLAGEPAHDLWAINTDYEYQEASRIDATGLVEAKRSGVA